MVELRKFTCMFGKDGEALAILVQVCFFKHFCQFFREIELYSKFHDFLFISGLYVSIYYNLYPAAAEVKAFTSLRPFHSQNVATILLVRPSSKHITCKRFSCNDLREELS